MSRTIVRRVDDRTVIVTKPRGPAGLKGDKGDPGVGIKGDKGDIGNSGTIQVGDVQAIGSATPEVQNVGTPSAAILNFKFPSGGPKGDPGSAGEGYATRVALAAATPTDKDDAYLTEFNRKGKFVFDASDLSASVTADPMQGVFVAPSSDTTGASGAWVRQEITRLDPRWFGAQTVPNGTPSALWPAYDIKPALDAAQVLMRGTGVSLGDGYLFNSFRVYIPWGRYYCSTWNMTDALHIEGDLVGDQTERSLGTTIYGPQNAHTWITNRSNTFGAATVPDRGWGADGATIRNIAFVGWNNVVSGSSPDGYGVWLRARANFENCVFTAFGDHGVYIRAYAGAGGISEGNANTCGFINCSFNSNGGFGLYVEGADANVTTTWNCKFRYNRLGALAEQSFLGGGKHVFETEGNCVSDPTGCGRPTPVVSHNGLLYVPVYNGSNAASTNAPSGTETDNAYWVYSPGTNGTHQPWVSGMTIVHGSTVVAMLPTTEVTLVSYHEGGQPAVQIGQRVLMTGATGIAKYGPGIFLRGEGGALQATAFATAKMSIGSYADPAIACSIASGSEVLEVSDVAGADYLDAKFQGADGNSVFRIYDPTTALNGLMEIGQLRISRLGFNTLGTGRRIAFIETTADFAGVYIRQGDLFFYTTPAAGGKLGLVCTTEGIGGSTAVLADFGRAGPLPVAALGGDYTATLAAADNYLRFTSGSATNFTIPPNSAVAFPVGTEISGIQAGAGAVTLVAGSGVTLNAFGGDLTLAGAFSAFTLKKVGVNEWDVMGKFQ